ncbi:MAG: ATP-binding cassette domain-containing protein [Methylobacteriaceae bacterium]|jgi:D-methionine transport system ATP-binding protein|nr:ATP-binding cassette domain-containing protein [Methylobacteriaceae bacterium]
MGLQSVFRKSNVVLLSEVGARFRKPLHRAAVDTDPSPVHIRFEHLHKRYSGIGDTVALKDISFDVHRSDIFGIIGRSGAGKSTLLRSVNMLEKPTSGRVSIDGIDIGTLSEEVLVARRRRIGMIFQHFNLLSAKTVRDNIGLPLKVAGADSNAVRRRVDELLEMVHLTEKADVYPANLSGGQKQRVGIARALVHNPEILLCDEATSALDPETTLSILELLREINEKLKITIVLITHDMSVIRAVCHKVVVLDQGEIVEQGDVWTVFGNPVAEATRALLSPLKRDLPDDLKCKLTDDITPDYPARALLSLTFSGEDQSDGLSLANLLSVAPDMRLLHGGLDRIQGHSQGTLLVSAPAETLDTPALQSLCSANRVKVLGYVPDDV